MHRSVSLVMSIGHLQSLDISGKPRDTHQGVVIDLEASLKVAVDRHQLSRKASISSNGDTVLTCHRDHRVSVVLVLKSTGIPRSLLCCDFAPSLG